MNFEVGLLACLFDFEKRHDDDDDDDESVDEQQVGRREKKHYVPYISREKGMKKKSVLYYIEISIFLPPSPYAQLFCPLFVHMTTE